MQGLGYPERVRLAVRDPEWQMFRKSLKGTQTEVKLRLLRSYMQRQGRPEAPQGSQEYHDIRLRVENYLKALARGGQILPSADYITSLKLKTLKIRR